MCQGPEAVAYPEASRHWYTVLGAQIKGELMQNNISHLIISSAQHFSKTFGLKTLSMPGSPTQVCLNV